MFAITKKSIPQVYNHLVTKSDIESLAENLKKNIFKNSNGISELVSLTVLKLLVESLDKKLRSEITLLDSKATFGKIIVEKSTSPTLLNYEDDPVYTKLKSSLDARTELLKQQYKLHSKHRKDNPGKDFIGIVEDTGEQVVIVSQKEGTGREIIKVTVCS
jgi:hypothetical protein